jgi:quercetin dioxygenase-like cupin family protein
VRCTRLYADPDGTPRFDEIEYELGPVNYAPPAPPVDVSAPTPADAAMFMRFPAGFTSAAHPTPVRQLALVLQGEIIGVAGQESRRFGPGDVLLMEDTHGPGHETHAPTDIVLVIVRL